MQHGLKVPTAQLPPGLPRKHKLTLSDSRSKAQRIFIEAVKRHLETEPPALSKRARFLKGAPFLADLPLFTTDLSSAQDENVAKVQKALQAANHVHLEEEQGEAPVLDGPPPSQTGPPIGLYHPVFNSFMEGLKAKDPIPVQTRRSVRSYIELSARIYRSEDNRMLAIRPVLQDLFGGQLISRSERGVQSGGVLIVECPEWTANALVFELKNEIGTGSVDPHTHCNRAYAKYTSSVDCTRSASSYLLNPVDIVPDRLEASTQILLSEHACHDCWPSFVCGRGCLFRDAYLRTLHGYDLDRTKTPGQQQRSIFPRTSLSQLEERHIVTPDILYRVATESAFLGLGWTTRLSIHLPV